MLRLSLSYFTKIFIFLHSVCHDSCDSCNGPENVNCTSCKTDSYIFVTSQLKSMCITSNQCWSLSLEVDSSSEQCLNVKDLNKCRALRKSLVLTSDESDGLDITGESKCVSTCPKGTYQKVIWVLIFWRKDQTTDRLILNLRNFVPSILYYYIVMIEISVSLHPNEINQGVTKSTCFSGSSWDRIHLFSLFWWMCFLQV